MSFLSSSYSGYLTLLKSFEAILLCSHIIMPCVKATVCRKLKKNLLFYLFIDRAPFRTMSAIVWKQKVSVNIWSGLIFGSCRTSLVRKYGFYLRHHDVFEVQSYAKPVFGRNFEGEIMGGNHFFRIPCVIRNLKIQMLCETG